MSQATRRISVLCKWMLWICCEILAKKIDQVITISPTIHSSSDIDDLSDPDLCRLRAEKFAQFPPKRFEGNQVANLRITDHTVLKPSQDVDEDSSYPSEALALQLVAEQTSIPVPSFRRVVRGDVLTYIAMEYIPGEELTAVWPTLSWFGRLRIAFTIRSYIRQLRAIYHPRSSIPGPLGCPEEGARTCISPLFGPRDDVRGPFQTYVELANFFNARLALQLRCDASNPFASRSAITTPFDDSEPLVLTHQDLNPRNFIVGDDGTLWLIDWAWAGFYPPWFEFVAMQKQAANEEIINGRKDLWWDAMIPFICGWHFKQLEWIDRIAQALNFA